MTESLTVDIGASTATLARRRDSGPVTSEIVPALVARAADGRLVVGRAAAGIAAEDPGWAVPIPVERAGDGAAVLVGGQVYASSTLVADALAGLAQVAADRLDAHPTVTNLVHAGHWTPVQRAALVEAARRAGLPGPVAVPAPVAAAGLLLPPGSVPAGSRVALCDLGATAEVSILTAGADGTWVLEEAGGLPTSALVAGGGGLAWDELVLDWAWASLDDDTVARAVRATGLQGRWADAFALRSARQAREALTSAPRAQVTIPVPGDPIRVDVRRSDLVELVAPSLFELAAEVRRLSGGAASLAGVHLFGGAAATPQAAALLGEAFGKPVAVALRPATVAAAGAALRSLVAAPPPPARVPVAHVGASAPPPTMGAGRSPAGDAGAPAAAVAVAPEPSPEDTSPAPAGPRLAVAPPPVGGDTPPPAHPPGSANGAGAGADRTGWIGSVLVAARAALTEGEADPAPARPQGEAAPPDQHETVPAQPGGPAPRRRWRRWAGLGLAAALVVAALIVFGTNRSHAPRRGAVPTVPATQPPPRRSTTPTAPKGRPATAPPPVTAPPPTVPPTSPPSTPPPATTPPPARKTSTATGVPSLATARAAVLDPELLGPYATLLGQAPFCPAVPKPSVEAADDYRLANGGWLETFVAAWSSPAAAAGVVRDLPTALSDCIPGAPPVVARPAPGAPAYGQQSFVGGAQAVLTDGAPYTYYLGVVREGRTVSVLAIRNANTDVDLATYDVIFSAAVHRLAHYVR